MDQKHQAFSDIVPVIGCAFRRGGTLPYKRPKSGSYPRCRTPNAFNRMSSDSVKALAVRRYRD